MASSRRREEARALLQASLQRVVFCLTPAVLVRGRRSTADAGYWFLDDRYVSLPGRLQLELSVLHSYGIGAPADGPSRVLAITTGYFYHFRERNGPEVILFHWHPFPGQVQFPHLHMSGGAGSIAIDARRHIPTGPLSLHAVVRFAIAELGVRPLRGDWESIVDEGASEGPN